MIPRVLVRWKENEDGAILLFAVLIVTVIALVTGAVLTRGDGSLRAGVALRDVARSSYAADGAAQVAINALRTGYNIGDGEPRPWGFNSGTGTGCFGYDSVLSGGAVKDTLQLNSLVPKGNGAGGTQSVMSAAVTCAPENDTGQQGSAVPITNANKPGNAILTLGTSASENGFTFKTNGSGGAFRVRGGIWSNSTIVRDNNGNLESTESIRAHTGCTPLGAMVAPIVNCGAGTAGDPNYQNDLDLAGLGIPALKTAPSGCGSGTATFQPGYYDDVAPFNALTPNGGSNCLLRFQPGTYYFDFHNNSNDPLFDSDIASSAGDVWNINSGTVVAGAGTSITTIPGRCVNPIDDVNAQGVQFIFGGDSRIVVDKGAKVEICASYQSNRPPIAVYGQKSGTTASSTVGSALTTSGTPTVSPSGSFLSSVPPGTGSVTAANLQDTTPANGSAVWQRDGTGGNLSSSITMSGFAPATALPKGTVVTGATLSVTHRSSGSANAVTLTPNVGAGLSSYTLPARTTLGTQAVDLTACTGWGAFQKSVHDNGFTGATLKFDATLGKNQVSELDAASLQLTYRLPQLRGETTGSISPNTVAAVGGSPLFTALGNNTLLYIQGTTYAPLASLNLGLNNIAESVFRFGVIARSLYVFETGSFSYPGAVIELPDNSPGYGFNGTIVQLKVYLCPGIIRGCTPAMANNKPALKARVQAWDPSGAPDPPKRQMTVLSWSHTR